MSKISLVSVQQNRFAVY